jgi:hypothetical protein
MTTGMSELSVEQSVTRSRPLTPGLALRDTVGVAKRNLLRIVRTPLMLVVTAIQPALLLVFFRYVLGGAIRIPGGSYVDYVVTAIFSRSLFSLAVMVGAARPAGSIIGARARKPLSKRRQLRSPKTLGQQPCF